MAVDNLELPRYGISPSKAHDDAHLLIGKALSETIRREDMTDAYVRCPPACYITDSDGAVLTMGFDYIEYPFHYEFMVLRNDKPTGQFAQYIELRGKVVHLLGRDGDRVLSRNKRHFI